MDGQSAAPTVRLRRAEGLLAAAVGDELVMMSSTSGRYFNLNEVGARIWELLAEPASVDELVAALAADYRMDDDGAARAQVEAFLATMRADGLLLAEGD